MFVIVVIARFYYDKGTLRDKRIVGRQPSVHVATRYRNIEARDTDSRTRLNSELFRSFQRLEHQTFLPEPCIRKVFRV